MQICPYPGCGYRSDYFISKTHCKANHQMSREEIFKKYGQPAKKNTFNQFESNKESKALRREVI